MEFDDVKLFVCSTVTNGNDQITQDRYYEVIQSVQYTQDISYMGASSGRWLLTWWGGS